MNKSKLYLFSLMIIIALLFVVGMLTTPVGASQPPIATPIGTTTPPSQKEHQEKTIEADVPKEIKSVIKSYFDIRYQAFNTLQLNDFGDLIADTPEAKIWLNEELGKLAVEIKHAELNQLRYAEYKYSLSFKSITIDSLSQTAIISVIEKHDILFENQHNVEDPHVTHMTGREHIITLHKEQEQWKIVSDDIQIIYGGC